MISHLLPNTLHAIFQLFARNITCIEIHIFVLSFHKVIETTFWKPSTNVLFATKTNNETYYFKKLFFTSICGFKFVDIILSGLKVITLSHTIV